MASKNRSSVTITKTFLLLCTLAVAACANQQLIISDALSKCPAIGIDISNPDFNQKHSKQEINQFYRCMESTLTPDESSPFGKQGSPMMTGSSLIKARLLPSIRYQHNLWNQVTSKEKRPDTAYEDWSKWQQQERSITASHQTPASAPGAANTINQPTHTTCMVNGPFLNCNSF